KSRQANFASLLFQQMDNMTDPANAEGRLTPDGIRIGAGAKLGSVSSDLSTGTISETDRILDTALLADHHLFQIQVTENGVTETQYTRDGAFYLNPVNNDQAEMLTTKEGHPVLGENGPIIIPTGFEDVQNQPNGATIVHSGVQPEQVANIAVVGVDRPGTLDATRQKAFRMPHGADSNIGEMIRDIPDQAIVLQSGA